MQDFKDKVDYETQCYSAINEFMRKKRPPECTGVIAAGELHNLWRNYHPKNAIRTCRHCVRQSNWDRHYKDKGPLLTKVELTRSDGSKMVLEGEAALEWESMASYQAVMSLVHGVKANPLPWIEIPPPPIVETPLVFRYRYRLAGRHVEIRVFVGYGHGSLGKAGDLVMTADEWEQFRTAVQSNYAVSFEIIPEETG